MVVLFAKIATCVVLLTTSLLQKLTLTKTSLMNIQEICRAIVSTPLTREDLDAIYNAAKLASDSLASIAGMSFKVGDDVYFDAKTRGVIQGEIVKINRKSIKISANNGSQWKVHPEFVRKGFAQG